MYSPPSSLFKASFLARPNRFTVICQRDGREITAYLPNPGRLWELLLPGRTLYLIKRKGRNPSGLQFTVLAVEKEGCPIFLHTHLTNEVAHYLLDRGMVPGLEAARVVRREISLGGSRFDFLLEKEGRPLFLEVKSCTLCGGKIAMFPDAVTSRGRKHLKELLDLSKKGMEGGVLFLVHWGKARFFLPDYHTDFDFALAFKELKDKIYVKAIALNWQRNLHLDDTVRELAIPWQILDVEARDRGVYLLSFFLPKDSTVGVGSLGEESFPAGYSLYVGTAKRALSARLKHHQRLSKKTFWHMDYLRPFTRHIKIIPIRGDNLSEHSLARAVSSIASWSIPRFGASDCNCRSHLFGMEKNPLHLDSFMEILQCFRIDRLEKVYNLSIYSGNF